MRHAMHTSSARNDQGQDLRLKRCFSCQTVGYEDDIYCPRCGKMFISPHQKEDEPITRRVALYCARCGGKLCKDQTQG